MYHKQGHKKFGKHYYEYFQYLQSLQISSTTFAHE